MNTLLNICLSAFVVGFVCGSGLIEEFTWTRINYQWPKSGERLTRETTSTGTRFRYSSNPNLESPIIFDGETNADTVKSLDKSVGSIDYIFENNIPMGANVWKNKLFITVPRRRLGVPSTLNYVPLDSKQKHNVPLIPYPNWRKNLYPDPNGGNDNFVSVYRIGIDACDRLWFVDTGVLELPGNSTKVKPVTIVIMDLNTDKVIHSYVIPEDHLRPATTLASITLDVTENDCGNGFAYMPDLSGYGVVVYSLKEDKSWRVSHNYFYVEPLQGEFSIAGHRFQWNDGVFSLELSNLKSDGFRDMYFHSMAGSHMYKVSTRIMRNETLATRSYHENDFVVVGDRGSNSQTSSADIHKSKGIMFLALVNQNALGCWNIKKPLNTISLVKKDDRKFSYPCDVKVSGDRVYVITNGMPGFLYGSLNYDEILFRVWSNTIKEAVRNTMC